MSPVLVNYAHFLGIASRLRWDEHQVDLSADARRWRSLEPHWSRRVTAFVAGFALAERCVAVDLEPFIEAAPSPGMADCFRAQARDEARHARFFDRYAREVLGTGGETPADRLAVLRDRVDPAFARLFEERLGAVARSLAGGSLPLADAVALYHLVLEGIVFSAGQAALLADLEDRTPLPGLREGLERVMADERWHIGLGVRVLSESASLSPAGAREGDAAVGAWGHLLSPDQRDAALRLHRRRLSAAGLPN